MERTSSEPELGDIQDTGEMMRSQPEAYESQNTDFSASQGTSSDDHRNTSTQTTSPHYKVIHEANISNATGANLLREYHKTVREYMRTANTSDMTELRSEICGRIQRRDTFQENVYGDLSVGLDEPPPNLFSSLIPSLLLSIYGNGQFALTTPDSTILQTGHIDEADGQDILSNISKGILRPGLLKHLLDMNLTWYDGCLICEITDHRRKLNRRVRTHLRVAQEDIIDADIETQQQIVTAQYPLLCLDPDKQVGNLARVAFADRKRWEPSSVERESKMRFVARKCPSLFIKPAQVRHEVTRADEDAFRAKMIQSLMTEYRPM